MSPRKSGRRKAKRKTLNIDEELHKLLENYAKKKHLKMTLIVKMFLEHGVEQDIFDPEWRENAVKALEIENELAGMKVECQALSKPKGDKTDFKCVWYRDDSTPLVKKIGDNPGMAKAVCAACRRTSLIVEGFKERDVKIAELETELKGRAAAVFKVPKCNRGAVLNHDKEDQLVMTNCFRHRGRPVSVNKFCRVQARGLPCMFFAFLVVGVEGKMK